MTMTNPPTRRDLALLARPELQKVHDVLVAQVRLRAPQESLEAWIARMRGELLRGPRVGLLLAVESLVETARRCTFPASSQVYNMASLLWMQLTCTAQGTEAALFAMLGHVRMQIERVDGVVAREETKN